MKKPTKRNQQPTEKKKCKYCNQEINWVLRVDKRGKARMCGDCKCQ